MNVSCRCVMVIFYAELGPRLENAKSNGWNPTTGNAKNWWGTMPNGVAPWCHDEQFSLTTAPPTPGAEFNTYTKRLSATGKAEESAIYVMLRLAGENCLAWLQVG